MTETVTAQPNGVSGQKKPLFRPSKPKVLPKDALPPWWVLVVDDDPTVHQMTDLVLREFAFEARPVRIINAYSAGEALKILRERDDVAVAFVDVVMEEDTAGLDLVRWVRNELANREIQLILRTGQPGSAPELEVLLEYEINDYCQKAELTQTRLLTALVSALRNYKRVVMADTLHNQQKLARSIDEAKTLFFAQASHELRTPVSGMIGLCDVLQGTALSEEQSAYVRSIADNGQMLLTLVNDILDFSKLQAGKFELEEVDFHLRELIESVARLLQPLCPPEVLLQTSIAPDVPDLAKGDPVRLKQILNNLAGNALKFTAQGEVRIEVSMGQRDKSALPEGFVIQVAVADTGLGIAADKLPKLFGDYEQVRTPGGAPMGTGLGLSICRKLCRLMAGDIGVTSEVGKGSVFTFTACLKPGEERVEQTRRAQPVMSPRQTHILVTDDNPTNRLIAKKSLEKLGFQVRLAESGEETLHILAREPVDLILMDCHMPEMDGFELTHQIRASGEPFHNVPIIACSATDDISEKQQCIRCGMNDFLGKPIQKEALREMLGKWLGYRSFM